MKNPHFAIDARPGIMMKLISLIGIIIVVIFKHAFFLESQHVKPIEYVGCFFFGHDENMREWLEQAMCSKLRIADIA